MARREVLIVTRLQQKGIIQFSQVDNSQPGNWVVKKIINPKWRWWRIFRRWRCSWAAWIFKKKHWIKKSEYHSINGWGL